MQQRYKKAIRVIIKKWKLPALKTILVATILYYSISFFIITKQNLNRVQPHFVITKISHNFDNTEFMHLLLTIQELRIVPLTSNQLIKFVNSDKPMKCPDMLERQLYRMNWAPQAFLSRTKKLFNMLEIYERIALIEENIEYFENLKNEEKLEKSLYPHLELLINNRDEIFAKEITKEEYDFIKEYSGLVKSIKTK